MITLKHNMDAQTIDLYEGEALVASLSYPEITQRGFRCELVYENVLDEKGRIQDRKVVGATDISKLDAVRGEMPIKLRSGSEHKVPCITVSKSTPSGQKKLVDVMLPFDEDDLE